MSQSHAQQIGDFVAADHALSPELEDWMRLLHLDYAAVTTGGLDRDSAAAVLKAVPTFDEPSLAAPCSVVATPTRYAAEEHAALINGTIAHGLELDDTHEEGSLHPAVVIFPALFAVAETEGAAYGEVLTAAAVGYEVMCRTAVLIGSAESYGRGFHPTAISGSIGAAAAVSRLLGLDAAAATNAVAVGANLAAGSLEFLSDGSWTKRLNAGHAAANGIRAARLAQVGFDAPATAFEGDNGFLYQYGRGAAEGRELRLELGSAALETSIKFYPCCRYMHGNIDLLREIHHEHPNLDPAEITAIDAAVITAGARLVSEPAERKLIVTSPVDAQFNMPFGAALAITTGEATVADFDNAPEVAKGLAETMAKVRCYTDEEVDAAYPARWQARVTVTLADGTVISRFSDAFVGSATKRATWGQIQDKAASLVGQERARELAEHARSQALEAKASLAGESVLVG